MRQLALIYGLRLLPAEEIEGTQDAPVQLKDGRQASVTMHLIEGATETEIRQQLERSIDAFFEFYPEV
jgi:hypothetical protein